MGTRKFNPFTPSRRYISVSDFEEVTSSEPLRSLIQPLRRSGGRNNTGRVTSWQRGGGHKRRFRLIDFRRDKAGVPGQIAAIQYDPNRTARIALVNYQDGEKRYILAPLNLKVGDKVVTSDSADILPGNTLRLGAIPLGVFVHNVELHIGRGGQLCRSAGAFAQVMAKEGDWVLLRLPSGELRKVHERCLATIGQVGNLDHENIIIGKAGRKRWMGKRPVVRGTAMNPIDHPHGGGEGRSKGNHPMTPWGKPTKGYKTRSRKKPSWKFIVKRRNSP